MMAIRKLKRGLEAAPVSLIGILPDRVIRIGIPMLIIMLATSLQARTQPAAESPFVPCNGLPRTAVTSIPSPFDRYMQFQCHKILGQGLRAVDGFHWADWRGYGVMLSSTSAAGRASANGQRSFPLSWYTELTPVTLSPPEIKALRTSLKSVISTLPRFLDETAIDAATFLELKATTSNAEEKRILLVVPDTKPGLPIWLAGFECNGACFRDDLQPLGFSGRPN